MHSFALIHALFWACICRFAVSVTVGQKVALRRRQFFVVHHFLNQRAERRSWKDRWEGRLDWDAHVRTFTEDEFRLNYRVSFGLFNKLIREIGPRLRTANITKVLSIFTSHFYFHQVTGHEIFQQADASSCGALTPEIRLAVALRWLAGGSYQDIYRLHRVCKTTMYTSCIWPVVETSNPKDKRDRMVERMKEQLVKRP